MSKTFYKQSFGDDVAVWELNKGDLFCHMDSYRNLVVCPSGLARLTWWIDSGLPIYKISNREAKRIIRAAMIPKIECPKCKGEGVVVLTPELAEVYFQLDRKGMSATEMMERIGWKGHPTAINNRLNDLVAHGLATRKKRDQGKTYHYIKAQ